jgi:chromosome segregation ATPase
MANTDFFDDDLGRQRDAARRIKLSDEPLTTLSDMSSDDVPVRPLSDLSLTRMAKHKQDVDENVVQAAQELERLRKRQETLEREKRDLEEIRRKQEEYERGKRDVIERLGQSLVTMEKDELQAERMAELLNATRKQFKEMLAEVEKLNEALWPEERFGEELTKALALVEDTRMEYNKSLSKIEAAGGTEVRIASSVSAMGEPPRLNYDEERPFGYWLKVGMAVSLPLIVFILLVVILFIVMRLTYVV